VVVDQNGKDVKLFLDEITGVEARENPA